jgi:hypothetical protein
VETPNKSVQLYRQTDNHEYQTVKPNEQRHKPTSQTQMS